MEFYETLAEATAAALESRRVVCVIKLMHRDRGIVFAPSRKPFEWVRRAYAPWTPDRIHPDVMKLFEIQEILAGYPLLADAGEIVKRKRASVN